MHEIIEEHYRKHRASYVKRLTFRAGSLENAEDIVQEAYARAIQYKDSFKEGEVFGKWFNRIANNCLRDFKRAEKGGPLEFEEENVEGFNCTGLTRKVLREIEEAIESKSSLLEREVLSLYFLQGYKIGDVVRIMDTKYKSTENMIQRFRRGLKEAYK